MKKEKELLFGILSRIVTWLGILLVALLALPAGLLIAMICGVWTAIDWIMEQLERIKPNK